MKARILFLFVLLCVLTVPIHAQTAYRRGQVGIGQLSARPPCGSTSDVYVAIDAYVLYTCIDSLWTATGSGSGTNTFIITNAASTGTTLFKLAKLTGSPSTAIVTTAGDAFGAVGIVVNGAGTSGSATVQYNGTASCVFDGATAANHYVTISATVAGDCHDAGATPPTLTQDLGQVTTTNVAGGTYSVDLFSPGFTASGSGGGGIVTALAGQCPYISPANTVTGSAVCLDMAGIAGADLGTVMNNCQSQLPAGGGTCNGDGLPLTQTLSTSVTTTKPVVFTFCGQQVSQSANVTFGNANSGIKGCPTVATLFTKAGNIDQFTLTGFNAIVDSLELNGVNTSFTGKGITASSAASGTLIQNNVVLSEAGTAIIANNASIVYRNLVLGVSGVVPMSGNAVFVLNGVSAINSDGILVTDNLSEVIQNLVGLAPNGVSGKCAINVFGDILMTEIASNDVGVTDNAGPGTDFNYGVCLTSAIASNHLFLSLVHDNHVLIQVSGGNSADGFWLNNTNNELTEFSSNVFRNNTCVHEAPACVKWTDPTAQPNTLEDFGFNNQLYDTTNSTGGTGIIFIQKIGGFSFATLPASVGNGSKFSCSDCQPGAPPAAGGGSQQTVEASGGVMGTHAKSFFTMLDSAYTNSTVTASNLIGIAVAPNVHYAGYCQLNYKAAASGGLVVSWTDPASPFYLISSLNQSLSVSTVNLQSGFNGSAQGVAVTTANTDLPARIDFSFRNGGGAGTLQLKAASTAAVTLTVEEGSYCWAQEE